MLPAVASTIVSPGAQDAPALGVEHDRERDAVLDAAARVEVLALDEHRHVEPRCDRPELHERRVADLGEYRGVRRIVPAYASKSSSRNSSTSGIQRPCTNAW